MTWKPRSKGGDTVFGECLNVLAGIYCLSFLYHFFLLLDSSTLTSLGKLNLSLLHCLNRVANPTALPSWQQIQAWLSRVPHLPGQDK